ncbi:MAG: RNA polymerase sigma factor [Planctomycetota bacterium]
MTLPSSPPDSADSSRVTDVIGRDAFARLFADASRRAWVVAMGVLLDRHGADDVVQEAAAVAWRRRETFAVGTNFAAWICRIAHHCALARRRKKRPDSGLDTDRVIAPKPTTADADIANLEGLGLGDALIRSLLALAETPRACLLMRVVLEASYDDIADALEIPPATAMSHVHRSRQRLAQHLGSPAAVLEHEPARESNYEQRDTGGTEHHAR